jgi:predicted nuclease of predicted toxin-antitoxin system
VRLLIDEHLSPRLAARCAERWGLFAASVPHVGLAGKPDDVVWRYAFDHDFVVVTTSARDFLDLLDIDLHPGLIVLRESGLSRTEQRDRMDTPSRRS